MENDLDYSHHNRITTNGNEVEDQSTKAARQIDVTSKQTLIFDEDAYAEVPRFHRSELEVGCILGRGGFCAVSEIMRVTLIGQKSRSLPKTPSKKSFKSSKNKYHSDDDEEEDQDQAMLGQGRFPQNRNFISHRYLRNGQARYAIKVLLDSVKADPELTHRGILDLAIEAKFLAVLQHPNIIKMRGISDAPNNTTDFFVILDRLQLTLDKKISQWRGKNERASGVLSKILMKSTDKKKDLWIERLTVAYDLASALRFLHNLSIIYRDLKPDNIGFDVRGDVKLFDFGLAKELHDDEQMDNGLYKLTGFTGSLRYMSPEVYHEQPYNETADVYSFGILLWYIVALETPFKMYTPNMHRDRVMMRGYRPKINSKWRKSFSKLLNGCWDAEISQRPSFQDVCDQLRMEIRYEHGEEEQDTLDISSRTRDSFEGGTRGR